MASVCRGGEEGADRTTDSLNGPFDPIGIGGAVAAALVGVDDDDDRTMGQLLPTSRPLFA
jgi:hypothetical protein